MHKVTKALNITGGVAAGLGVVGITLGLLGKYGLVAACLATCAAPLLWTGVSLAGVGAVCLLGGVILHNRAAKTEQHNARPSSEIEDPATLPSKVQMDFDSPQSRYAAQAKYVDDTIARMEAGTKPYLSEQDLALGPIELRRISTKEKLWRMYGHLHPIPMQTAMMEAADQTIKLAKLRFYGYG